jgi:hypothetical protein
MLIKINDLDERLLETQLQLERVTDEKLAHMLSIQKSPTDKTRLGYVTPPSNIPSTYRTVFVKPIVSKPPLTVVDKGKDIISGDIPVIQKLPTIRRPPICHHNGACPTPVFPSQGSKIKGQERGAQTCKLRCKTFGPTKGSKASGLMEAP